MPYESYAQGRSVHQTNVDRPTAFIYLPSLLISSIVQDKIKLCPNRSALQNDKAKTYKNHPLTFFFA
jgi:hypothetical protein